MKALSILQPYAHLIVTPQSELPDGYHMKRVENRTWYANHRGPLLIHTGKSHRMMGCLDEERLGKIPYGAVVGIASVLDVVHIANLAVAAAPWVRTHVHTEGPYCWILGNVQRFKTPVPYPGSQGLFQVTSDEVDHIVREGLFT